MTAIPTAATGRRTVEVQLSAPVEWFNTMISSVKIREPNAATFFDHGAPEIIVHSPAGGVSVIDSPAALKAYAQRCIMVEQGDNFLNLISLADGIAIKKVLLSFFRDAPAETPD